MAASSGAQTARVALRWAAVPGATLYELQISSSSDFVRPELEQTLSETLYRWEKLPTVPYYWRVRSIDSEGRKGIWSPAQKISPPAQSPVLLKPEAGAALTLRDSPRAVELRFEVNKVLKNYLVELSPDPRFVEPLRQTVDGSPASFTLPRPGTYFWRVSAVDIEGHPVPPGAARTFHLRLEAPSGLAGASRVAWEEPAPSWNLSWRPHPLARSYRVELLEAGQVVATLEVHSPQASLSIPRPGEFSARVTAFDGAGGPSAPSEPFAVSVPPGPVVPLVEAEPVELPPTPPVTVVAPPPVAPRAAAAARLEARVGYCTSFGALSSPCGALELSAWLLPLPKPLSIALRLGFHGGEKQVALFQGAPLDAAVWVMPISALARVTLPAFERVDAVAALGPALIFSEVKLGSWVERRALPGAQALAGLSRPFGPGSASFEVGYLLGTFDGELARYRAGGLSVMAGYGVGL